MNVKQISVGVVLLLTTVAVGGCSSGNSADAIVQGNVTIDGVLASRGTVTFHPVKEGPVAVGQIHTDGSYSLRTGLGNTANPDQAKIKPGKYLVTVMVMGDPPQEELKKEDGSPPVAGPRLTSIKYASKETSKLEFDIKPGVNLIPLELEGSANDPAPEPQVDEVSDESRPEESDGESARSVIDDEPEEAVTTPESTPVREEVQ